VAVAGTDVAVGGGAGVLVGAGGVGSDVAVGAGGGVGAAAGGTGVADGVGLATQPARKMASAMSASRGALM
jgi:hypothetical protein